MTPRLLVALALAVSSALPIVARAQQDAPPPSADAVAAGLRGIDASLAQLVRLMQKQAEQQDVALAMHRVELSTFLLIETGRQLSSKQDEREGLEDSVRSFDETVREMQSQLVKISPDEGPDEADDVRSSIARMEQEAAQQRDRLKRIELEIGDLQNQASSQRDEIARWQDVVDRYFERKR